MIDSENGTSIDKILTLDIGGTTIKATVLDQAGKLLQDYKKVQTPAPAAPEKVMEAIQKLIIDFPEYNRVSVGFPGYVNRGIVFTAPNLGTEIWKGFNLKKCIGDAL